MNDSNNINWNSMLENKVKGKMQVMKVKIVKWKKWRQIDANESQFDVRLSRIDVWLRQLGVWIWPNWCENLAITFFKIDLKFIFDIDIGIIGKYKITRIGYKIQYFPRRFMFIVPRIW